MPRKLTPKMKQVQWKKGQSGDPAGRKPNPIQRALKELTIDTYREVIELVLTGNMDSLKEIAQSEEKPAIQVGLARAFIKAIKDGNHEVMERLAERIVGKIPDQINVVSKNLNANIELPAESKVTKEEVAAAMAQLKNDV